MRTSIGLAATVLALGLGACGSDSGGGGGGGGGGGRDEAAARAAQDGCEAGITNNPAIPADKKAGLEAKCVDVGEAAGSGDKDRLQEAYASYCEELSGAVDAAARQITKDTCMQGAATLGS